MNRTLVFFIALLLLFAGSAMFWIAKQSAPAPAPGSSEPEVDTTYVATEKELTEFEFTDQLAQDFSSKELDDKVWMGTFFFADCPSICAIQNAEVSKLHQRFKDQGVMTVNITVAPEDDPPHKLFTYANRFSADHETWKFLTGRHIEYVTQVGQDIFGLRTGHITHTPEVAVFDREGKVQGTYDVTKGLEYAKCVKKVEELLAGKKTESGDQAPKGGAVQDDESHGNSES